MHRDARKGSYYAGLRYRAERPVHRGAFAES